MHTWVWLALCCNRQLKERASAGGGGGLIQLITTSAFALIRSISHEREPKNKNSKHKTRVIDCFLKSCFSGVTFNPRKDRNKNKAPYIKDTRN